MGRNIFGNTHDAIAGNHCHFGFDTLEGAYTQSKEVVSSVHRIVDYHGCDVTVLHMVRSIIHDFFAQVNRMIGTTQQVAQGGIFDGEIFVCFFQVKIFLHAVYGGKNISGYAVAGADKGRFLVMVAAVKQKKTEPLQDDKHKEVDITVKKYDEVAHGPLTGG